LGSRHVLIFGEDELSRGEAVLRDMKDGQEQKVDLQDLEQLAKILGECGQ